MKFYISILIFFSLVFNSCTNSNNKEVSGFIEEYQDLNFHFRVNVNSDWKKKENKGDGYNIVIWNLPPIKSAYEKNRVSPTIGVEASKNWNTFEEAVESSQKELKATSYNYYWDDKSNSGVYQYGDPIKKLKGKCYYIHNSNGIVYRLTFSANKDSYDQYISEFENFYKSFKTIK